MVLEMHLKGQDPDTPDIRELLREWKFLALITCNGWIDLFYETGDISAESRFQLMLPPTLT